MLNKVAVFLLLFIVWCLSCFFSSTLTYQQLIIGFFVSIFITAFVFVNSIIISNSKFLFLQIGFYKYIFSKLNGSIVKSFSICLSFLNPNKKFVSILDYVFLNKDSDSNAVFTTNLLTLMPGTIGILVKKRYLIVHSLDKDYFNLTDMYNISMEIEKIDDDALV
jgi:multisubunit Na+/H+ antiporter MnhE subunit